MTTTARLTVACVQMNSRDDRAENVAVATRLVEEAAERGARLIVLPETWNYRGTLRGVLSAGESLDGPSTTAMRALSARLGVHVLAGSFYETTQHEGRLYNTSVLIGTSGEVLAVYRKLHLFDAVSGTVTYRESDALEAGDQVVCASVEGVRVGMTICYDVRFPELYLRLAQIGAQVIVAPAAFTAYTGQAHWHLLVRARAVDSGCFLVAPDQVGFHTPENECFGHSLIIDPWGRCLAEVTTGVGTCVADLDLGEVVRVRDALPTAAHRRPDVYQLRDPAKPAEEDGAVGGESDRRL